MDHGRTLIETQVANGNYASIGSASIRERSEIGSGASDNSGKRQQRLGDDGKSTAFSLELTEWLVIYQDIWIGEGAILLGEIGRAHL